MNTVVSDAINDLEELDEVDLAMVKLDPRWAHSLPASGARRFRTIALCKVQGQVIVATSNPSLVAVRRFVSSRIRDPYVLVRSDQSSIRRLLGQLYAKPVPAADKSSENETCSTVQVCDELLRAACLRGASDIHLVPSENAMHCHFREDGLLEEFRRFDADVQAGLVSRIKVLAGLDIAEKREPQDGRFTLKETPHGNKVDVRVATLPTRFGERVTLRLLSPLHNVPSLANLGMMPRDLESFSGALQSPSGLILLTGPTGCGKSTTLYTAIKQLLETRGGNIITVEDPVEYDISGVTQVEVDSAEKVTFSRVLRSILRHDPDVIMLGEIRDSETAELAIKAALTGHLVFSTLHTNTAAGVVTRLVDMGIEPFLVASTLRMAIAQRLVRKLCSHCRQPEAITTTDAIGLGRPSLGGGDAYSATGCVYCAGKGFLGRTALFEMLRGGSDVSDLICRGVSESELVKHMQHLEMSTMMDDGVEKVLSGTTTVQQVLSVAATW